MKNNTHKEIIPILYNATQIMQLLLQSAFHSKEKKYLEILYYSWSLLNTKFIKALSTFNQRVLR